MEREITFKKRSKSREDQRSAAIAETYIEIIGFEVVEEE
jgi:hypothetical protein